jgi:hypothetical protein
MEVSVLQRYVVYLLVVVPSMLALLGACDNTERVGPEDIERVGPQFLVCNVAHKITRIRFAQPAETVLVRSPARLVDTTRLAAETFSITGAPVAGTQLFFTTTDTLVALVDPSGLLFPLSPGTAQIDALYCDEEASVLVNVLPAIATILVQPTEQSGIAGDTVPVKARALNPFGEPVTEVQFTFSIPNPSAARVEQTSDTTANVILLQTGTVRVVASAEGVSSS